MKKETSEIEVTPEMIDAGISEIFEHRFGEDAREIVGAIYMAMEYARLDPQLGPSPRSIDRQDMTKPESQ